MIIKGPKTETFTLKKVFPIRQMSSEPLQDRAMHSVPF